MKKMLTIKYLKSHTDGFGYPADDDKYLWYPMAIVEDKLADAIKVRVNDCGFPKEIACVDVVPLDSLDADSQSKFAKAIQAIGSGSGPLFLVNCQKRCNEIVEAVKSLLPAKED